MPPGSWWILLALSLCAAAFFTYEGFKHQARLFSDAIMGIYDREYYRREGPSILGVFAEQGRVTNWLIVLNIALFLAQVMTQTRAVQSSPDPADLPIAIQNPRHSPVTDALILDVPKVLQGQVWRLLSYAFLHSPDSIWHIVFNMLMLFWFGRQVEDTIGGREYLWFYLLSAILSGLGFCVAYKLGLHLSSRCLGASGAVTAALVVAACIDPRQIIYLFLILPVPIWAFVILNVAADAFSLFGKTSYNVATSAHLTGAAFGFCYYKFQWRLSGWTRVFSGWTSGRRSRPNLKVYREEDEEIVPPRPSPGGPPARLIEDEHLEAQVDSILEKIQRVGMQGLTDAERQVLVRASEAIKRRRS